MARLLSICTTPWFQYLHSLKLKKNRSTYHNVSHVVVVLYKNVEPELVTMKTDLFLLMFLVFSNFYSLSKFLGAGSRSVISKWSLSERDSNNTIEVGQGNLKLLYTADEGKLTSYINSRNQVCMFFSQIFHLIMFSFGFSQINSSIYCHPLSFFLYPMLVFCHLTWKQ